MYYSMKKHYLLTLIALPLFCISEMSAENLMLQAGTVGGNVTDVSLLHSSQLRSGNTQLADSVVTEVNGIATAKTSYKYNDKGQILESVEWEQTPLVPVRKHIYNYSGVGKNFEVDNYLWDGSTWGAISTETYAYDDQGRELLYELKIVEGVNWMQHIYRTTEYKDKQSIVITQDTIWNDLADNKPDKISYNEVVSNYDDKGNMVQEESYIGQGRQLWKKVLVEYGDDNRLVKRNTIGYNSDGSTQIKYRENWSYTGNDVYQYIEKSDGDSDVWTFYSEYKSESVGENPIIVTFYYNWNSKENPVWDGSKRQLFYYPEVSTESEKIDASESSVRIYTSNGSVVINTLGSEKVSIFSISGKCYYNARVCGMTNVSNLPAGIYIVRVGKEAIKVNVR